MPVPKKRHTKHRRDRARRLIKLTKQALIKCSNCGAMIKAHIACPKCGKYKGKEVINTLKKVKAKK
jgi:large subunit ribosomal protein L32